MKEVDVLVLGGGPAGCRAAVESVRLRRDARVALVERMAVVGGVCVNTGTIPSKTLREAILYLAGYHQRAYYGRDYRLKGTITQADLSQRTRHVIEAELGGLQGQLARVGVTLVSGEARFVGPHEVEVQECAAQSPEIWRAETILIATGSEAIRTPGIPYDEAAVIVPDELYGLPELPRSMAIIGAGVIGAEYASIYAVAGVDVTLIDARRELLPFLDAEIRDLFAEELQRLGVRLRLGAQVADVRRGGQDGVEIRLASGDALRTDLVMTAAGRAGNVSRLDLQAAGLAADESGRLRVDACYRTAVPHIFAVGDVVGFPSLASAAMEQGRLAAAAAAGLAAAPLSSALPVGIYTVPELAAVGKTEAQLRRQGIPYQTARARWSELSRGHIAGDEVGLLKLLWHPETRKVLGVHIVGEGATELIHLGHAVMALGGTVDYFVDAVFNYPTLAQAYKIAVENVGPPGR